MRVCVLVASTHAHTHTSTLACAWKSLEVNGSDEDAGEFMFALMIVHYTHALGRSTCLYIHTCDAAADPKMSRSAHAFYLFWDNTTVGEEVWGAKTAKELQFISAAASRMHQSTGSPHPERVGVGFF